MFAMPVESVLVDAGFIRRQPGAKFTREHAPAEFLGAAYLVRGPRERHRQAYPPRAGRT
jgi:hypothetical protein